MTTLVIYPRQHNSSASPTCSRGSTDVYSAFRFGRIIHRQSLRGLSEEMLEAGGFSALSEESFAEDWDNPEDAIYDDI